MKAYRQTPKGKAYFQSPEYQAAKKVYEKAYRQTPKGKAIRKTYSQTPGSKATQKCYQKIPESRAVQKAYRQSPKGKAYQRAYMEMYRLTPEYKASQKAYQKIRDKTPQFKAARSRQRKLRSANNPVYKMIVCLRSRMHKAFKGQSKVASTLGLLGCSAEQARVHIENQFKPGWTWANHGKVWHIDHIRPLASFKVMDEAEQRIAFHYTNLQPLLGVDNIKKGSLYNGVRHRKTSRG